MGKRRNWGIAVAAVVLLGGAGAWALGHMHGSDIPSAALTSVTRGDLSIVVAETGKVQPLRHVDIKSKVAGQVSQVLVREGQKVAQGQVLLTLDPTDFKRQLAQAQADARMAKAELAGMVDGPRPEDVASARADLETARAKALQADADRDRARRALASGTIAPAEWDSARADAMSADAQVRQAQSKLDELVAGPRQEAIDEARARLAKAQVAVEAAQDQLTYTVIRAPIAGTVIHRGIEEGEMVTPGVSQTAGDQQPLLTVADLSKLVVESDINQIDVGKLDVGQRVSIQVDSLPGESFTGKIYKVAPAAVAGKENGVELFPIQTLIDAGDAHLRPGMSADLDIFVQNKPRVLLLPVEAVLRDGEGLKGKVTLVKRSQNGQWQKTSRDVTLGASSDSQVEIVAGLAAGDQVLIDPASAKGEVNKF
ncbi:MAG TPA: efflux RND transporter periplasmic adaptor subunit [Oscillatoriaceae cyanobacterium]